KATSLPACTSAAEILSYDAVNATCLPPGTSPQQAGQTVKDQILTGQGFLNTPTINASSVKNGDSNQSIFADQLKDTPRQYQRAKEVPLILTILTVLAAIAIVFLSSNHWKGLRHIGITLLVIGLFMLIFAWGLNRVVSTKVVPKINVANSVL